MVYFNILEKLKKRNDNKNNLFFRDVKIQKEKKKLFTEKQNENEKIEDEYLQYKIACQNIVGTTQIGCPINITSVIDEHKNVSRNKKVFIAAVKYGDITTMLHKRGSVLFTGGRSMNRTYFNNFKFYKWFTKVKEKRFEYDILGKIEKINNITYKDNLSYLGDIIIVNMVYKILLYNGINNKDKLLKKYIKIKPEDFKSIFMIKLRESEFSGIRYNNIINDLEYSIQIFKVGDYFKIGFQKMKKNSFKKIIIFKKLIYFLFQKALEKCKFRLAYKKYKFQFLNYIENNIIDKKNPFKKNFFVSSIINNKKIKSKNLKKKKKINDI